MNTPGETTRSLGSISALYRILQAVHTSMRITESYNPATAYFSMLLDPGVLLRQLAVSNNSTFPV
jgi:hypothetical protein